MYEAKRARGVFTSLTRRIVDFCSLPFSFHKRASRSQSGWTVSRNALQRAVVAAARETGVTRIPLPRLLYTQVACDLLCDWQFLFGSVRKCPESRSAGGGRPGGVPGAPAFLCAQRCPQLAPRAVPAAAPAPEDVVTGLPVFL